MLGYFLWCSLQCRFAGVPPYSSCADNLDTLSPECADLKICVVRAFTWFSVTQSLFPDYAIVSTESFDDGVNLLDTGVCNVIAAESPYLLEASVRTKGFTGPEYEIGNNLYSKEPLP